MGEAPGGPAPAGTDPRDRLSRELSLTDATLLIVASVVGAGIFFTPGPVAALLPDPRWIFAAWTFGALLSLAGALANAELGAMFPHAGGDYVYLREAFHPAAGFLVGWLSFFAIYAGTIAALAAAFGEGLAVQLGGGDGLALGIAIVATLVVSALNYRGVRWGAHANNLTSGLKVLALLAFVIAAPLWGDGEAARIWSAPESSAGAREPTFRGFALAMSPILFTYLGWNASVYVASEIRDPGRNVPRSLFLGLALCGALYLAMNAVYLFALPVEALEAAPDAGAASARALFGPASASWVSAFVLLSVLGTLSATILVGPRIAYAMALDGLFFGGAERVSDVFRTPGVAIAVQAVVSVALLALLRNFPAALDFTTFAILVAMFADVAALIRLRARDPGRDRPYRAFGYPWLPALYMGVVAAIALAMLFSRTRESLAALLLLAAGLPFYGWLRARAR